MVIPIVPPEELSGAVIAQLGERQTEDLEVPGSIPGHGTFSSMLDFWRVVCCCTPGSMLYKPCRVCSASCLHRLAVRTSRCGRDNPGSNPGVDIFSFVACGQRGSVIRVSSRVGVCVA